MIYFFLLLYATLFAADATYWDKDLVRPYVHCSELQRRWAMAFMAPHLKELKGDEFILDVGCGDGKITADISKFVPEGKTVGIDLSSGMISWAQKQYHPLEYPNLMFQEGSFHEPHVEDQFDRIISFCAIQHSSDPLKAIFSLKKLLKPGGKLLILFPTRNNPAWNQSRQNVQKSEKWYSFFKDQVPKKILSLNDLEAIFKEIQFKEVRIRSIGTMDPFIDKKEIVTWLRGTFLPFATEEELLTEFYNDWIDEYLRLNPDAQDSEGAIYAKLGYVTIEAVN